MHTELRKYCSHCMTSDVQSDFELLCENHGSQSGSSWNLLSLLKATPMDCYAGEEGWHAHIPPPFLRGLYASRRWDYHLVVYLRLRRQGEREREKNCSHLWRTSRPPSKLWSGEVGIAVWDEMAWWGTELSPGCWCKGNEVTQYTCALCMSTGKKVQYLVYAPEFKRILVPMQSSNHS